MRIILIGASLILILMIIQYVEQWLKQRRQLKKFWMQLMFRHIQKLPVQQGCIFIFRLVQNILMNNQRLLAELIVNMAYRDISSFTSLERNPSKRKGKMYLDFLQNRTYKLLQRHTLFVQNLAQLFQRLCIGMK